MELNSESAVVNIFMSAYPGMHAAQGVVPVQICILYTMFVVVRYATCFSTAT